MSAPSPGGTDETCPACGFVWSAVAAPEIGERTVAGVAAIAARLRDGDAAAVTARPSPERWSALEYGCHVRDVLYMLRDRTVIGLVEDTPSFAPMYRDHRVDLGLYAADEPAVVADELRLAAALFARTFAALDDDQLARPCTYAWPTSHVRSLLWMAQQAVHEVEHHRADVEENLA
ncbi:MAG TPA: DinB family protein [Acidimicrobiales bacterium]|nr:DinB family protein [Acidimicrobiales bacterium]